MAPGSDTIQNHLAQKLCSSMLETCPAELRRADPVSEDTRKVKGITVGLSSSSSSWVPFSDERTCINIRLMATVPMAQLKNSGRAKSPGSVIVVKAIFTPRITVTQRKNNMPPRYRIRAKGSLELRGRERALYTVRASTANSKPIGADQSAINDGAVFVT